MTSRHPETSPPEAPEIEIVERSQIACDGGRLGHPRVWLHMTDEGFVECGYCDKRFILKGGPADTGGDATAEAGEGPGR